MKFYIEYRTTWGEDLRLCGSAPEIGNGLAGQALPMHTTDGIHWEIEVDIDTTSVAELVYEYMVFRDGEPVRREWNTVPRRLRFDTATHATYHLIDSWRDKPEDVYFYTSAFTEAIMSHPKHAAPAPAAHRQVVIKACAPRIDRHHVLCLSGTGSLPGHWDPKKALPMSDADFPTWQIALDATRISFPLEYKFILRDKRTGAAIWEEGANHCIPCPPMSDDEITVVGDHFPHFNLPAWRGAGVAIPVFSLRSEGSFGIGDFGDLKMFVDWAALTGQKVVQTLPINDTTMRHTRRDSYPYNSISIYALHPMYIDLRQLGRLADEEAAARLEQRRLELNALPAVDYEGVDAAKWEYLRLIYEQEGERTFRSPAYRRFYAANRDWLLPYAAYSYLRDKYGEPNFRLWPTHSVYQADEIDELLRPADIRHAAGLYLYIQYQLHRQLTAVTRQARTHGVALKGDIPIGISRNSVEAWAEPYYFNLDGQAGAPPDDFAVDGQNWGFPTYNWEVMQADGYAWWVKRFRKMAAYFDAFRIDHILGFFRIWEIPVSSVHGLLGQFTPSLPMSRSEIESYGLPFRDERFLRPYIDETAIRDAFGPLSAKARADYLQPIADREGLYALLPAVDTQRKVKALFADKEDEDSLRLRDGLYNLISNVLFLADTRQSDKYHPRIAAHHCRSYQALSDSERSAFSRLHEDYYYKRHDAFWRDKAMEKLPRLTSSTRMLVCGEDLGMIPACVPGVMNELGILSLEIERMPKEYGREFGSPSRYPRLSVCTISTHDMSTLRSWWLEDAARTQRYYNLALSHEGRAPHEATPEICREVLMRHLAGNSMLCILSWQDWLSIDGQLRRPEPDEERINVPANPRQYWRYRMHLTIEQLLKADHLNDNIRALVVATGRLSS